MAILSEGGNEYEVRVIRAVTKPPFKEYVSSGIARCQVRRSVKDTLSLSNELNRPLRSRLKQVSNGMGTNV